jgi:hypothetical protein
MPLRTTVDIPEPIHRNLRDRAQKSGVSIRSLIVQALEQAYGAPHRGDRLSGPLVRGKGGLGPAFPKDENPHDFVFS